MASPPSRVADAKPRAVCASQGSQLRGPPPSLLASPGVPRRAVVPFSFTRFCATSSASGSPSPVSRAQPPSPSASSSLPSPVTHTHAPLARLVRGRCAPQPCPPPPSPICPWGFARDAHHSHGASHASPRGNPPPPHLPAPELVLSSGIGLASRGAVHARGALLLVRLPLHL